MLTRVPPGKPAHEKSATSNRPLREDLAEERPGGCEHRHDLDPHSPKLRLDQGERLRSRRIPGGRHEAQREPLPAAGEDPVRTSAAAGLREQTAGLRRSIAVGAPVRLVVAALGHVYGAVVHASGGIDLAEYLSDERGAVDPVRERAANELVAERRVSVRPELDAELLESGACGRNEAHPRQPTNGRDDRWWNAHGDVELAAPQLLAGIGNRRT